MKPLRIITAILALALFAPLLTAQNPTGYPRWPLTTSHGCELVDFVPATPVHHDLAFCSATLTGGTGAAFDCCGQLQFYVLNSGVLDHFQLKAFSNTGELTLVQPDHTPYTDQGFEGIAGDNEIQVVPVPGVCRRWFIIYSRYENGHDGYSPTQLCYSRVEYNPDDPTNLIVHEKDVVMTIGGVARTYVHGKAVSRTGMGGDPSSRILYACRRSRDVDVLSIDRWIISGPVDQIQPGSPTNTGDVEAWWWPLTVSGSNLELNPDGTILAVINRNQRSDSASRYPHLILFKTSAFNTLPANCTKIAFNEQPLADLGNVTAHAKSQMSAYSYLAFLCQKISGIQFSPNGSYLWFTGGGYVESGVANCSYLGQLALAPLFPLTSDWNASGMTTNLPMRARVQHPHQSTSDDVNSEGRGVSTSTDPDYQQIGQIQRAYDDKLYFTKTNSATIFAIPSPDADLSTNLPAYSTLNSSRPNIDVSAADDITLTGDISFLPDQIDGYDYVSGLLTPIVVTATPTSVNLGGTVALTANQAGGIWSVSPGPPPSGGGTISGSGTTATFTATAAGNVVITYTIPGPSNIRCTGTANIWVNGPACPNAITTPIPGQNCCFVFRVMNDNPQLESVDRLVLHVSTSGISFGGVSASGAMSGWTVSGTGPDRTIQGGSAIAPGAWVESLMMCFQPPNSGAFGVDWVTYHGNEIVCRGKFTLDCSPVVDCDLQVAQLPGSSTCPCKWKFTMTNPSMIDRVVIQSLTPGVAVTETSDPSLMGNGWLATAPPSQVITYQGGDPIPAGTQKSIEFCISATGWFRFTTYWNNIRVCIIDSAYLLCKPEPPIRDCCDSLQFDKDVVIENATYVPALLPNPAYIHLKGRIFSDRPLTRFSVINERTAVILADGSCNALATRDVTGYFIGARGGTNSWVAPAGGFAMSPIPMTGDGLPYVAAYQTYGLYGNNNSSGGPREVRWNSQTTYDCANLPFGITNGASTFDVKIAWQPGELPSAPALQHYHEFQYTLRCEFTDTTCRTCWTRIAGVIPFRHRNHIVDLDPIDLSTIAMSDENHGTLTIAVPALPDSLSPMQLVGMSLRPESGVTILAMRDNVSGALATIDGNTASIPLNLNELDKAGYALLYDNRLSGPGFRNIVTLRAVFAASPSDTIVIEDSVFAYVPLKPGEAKDSLGVDTISRPIQVHTYAVYFTNSNAGKVKIRHIVLKPKSNRAAIIAVGPPQDTTEVAISPVRAPDGSIFFSPGYCPTCEFFSIVEGVTMRPIYLTVSGAVGETVTLEYLTLNDRGDTISVSEITLSGPLTTDVAGDWSGNGTFAMPGGIALQPCYPNPSMNSVTLQFSINGAARAATLVVTDVSGRIIETLFKDAMLNGGDQAVVYNTSHLPSGTYFYTLSTGAASKTQSFRIVR